MCVSTNYKLHDGTVRVKLKAHKVSVFELKVLLVN